MTDLFHLGGMDPTKKRLCSPGAGNDWPPKRTKISTQARAVLPRKRRWGLKDNRLITLQNLEHKRRCPVFGIDPSEIDALKHRKLTNGIPTLESQQPHQHSALLAGPLSPPTDDYVTSRAISLIFFFFFFFCTAPAPLAVRGGLDISRQTSLTLRMRSVL